jgi:hypothetical protein
MYVDESGDVGTINSPTRYFVLSGLVIHEKRWLETLDTLIEFRRYLRKKYELKLREEIHSTAMIHRPGKLARIQKHRRLLMLGEVLSFQARLRGISVLNIVLDKSNKANSAYVFENAWTLLLQRFHNTIQYGNFPDGNNNKDKGLVFTDQTTVRTLSEILRKRRRYNPVPSLGGGNTKDLPLIDLVDDPVHRDSRHSYFIQLADVNAYFLFQSHQACKYIRGKGAVNYFKRLEPVFCKYASTIDPFGIVRG